MNHTPHLPVPSPSRGEGEHGAAWRAVPLDAVVLSLCLLGALVRPPDASATLIAVAATFLLGVYWAAAFFRRQGEDAGRAFRVQLGIVLALIGLLVVMPTLAAIGDRHDTAPYRNVHDSALQIELATDMLLHGQNYYGATYFHTPLAQWWPVGPPNPALYHTDSLPFQEELTVPFMLAAKATLGWFDERFIYLLCLGAVLGMALALARTPTSRLALVAGLGLNPLFVPSFIAGQNDVLVLAEVMGVLLLARHGRRRAALLLLGTALATKETALFLVPFLLLWMAGQEDKGARVRTTEGATSTARRGLTWWLGWTARSLGWIALPVALFVGPFLLWDAHAFLDSTIGFVEGTVPHSFPIRGLEGYGFASFVLFGNCAGASAVCWAASSSSYWPFGVVQLLVAGPVALALLWRQRRANTLARAVAGYATTLFLMYYFGRFFHASFIAFTLSLVVLSFCLDTRARTHLSLDFLLLLLVVPQSLARPNTTPLALVAAVTMGLLVLYALLDTFMDGWNRDSLAPALAARNWRLRLGLALALLGMVVVWPETYGILARHAAHPWNYVHDVAMQVEEATKFLLAGKDFYAQTYVHTPMVHWYSSPAMAAALYHVDRLPFGIVASVPFYLVAQSTLGWFDERFVYLLCLALCVVLLLRLRMPRELRLAALAGVLLNPFFVPTLVYGQDDVLVLALLLLFARALHSGRFRSAALWLGLACATKHTALFMLPPYVVFTLAQHRTACGWRARLAAAWREMWPVLVVPALICMPFLAWNAGAFLAGNVGFLAGTVPHSYPIRGIGTYGFGAVVLLRGLVPSPTAYYPFTLWELAAALPLLAALVVRLWRAPSVREVFAMYALLLFACYFFSRFFQDSGLAYAVSAFVLAALLYPQKGPSYASVHKEGGSVPDPSEGTAALCQETPAQAAAHSACSTT
jgi:Glycosyltransferase family 87